MGIVFQFLSARVITKFQSYHNNMSYRECLIRSNGTELLTLLYSIYRIALNFKEALLTWNGLYYCFVEPHSMDIKQ